MSKAVAAALWLVLAAVFGASGCAGCREEAPSLPFTGDPPPKLCLSISAATNLNPYGGEPHVVALQVFAVVSESAFQDADPYDLMNGVRPVGLDAPVLELTVLPGDSRRIDEPLPADARFVGIVADFHDGPGRVLFKPECHDQPSKVVLSASDIQVESNPR